MTVSTSIANFGTIRQVAISSTLLARVSYKSAFFAKNVTREKHFCTKNELETLMKLTAGGNFIKHNLIATSF